MSIKQPDLSIVIPLFCEGAHLEACVAEVMSHVDSTKYTYEVVLIDDGSKDNTWEAVQHLVKQHKHITGLHFSRNFGKEAALWAGLEHARGRAVITIDADLQHPPRLIPEMLSMWESGYDVVDAVKTVRQQEIMPRRTAAYVFSKVLCRLSGFEMYGASDFKLLDRQVVSHMLRMNERQLFFRGLTEWVGFRHGRIPMVVAERFAGETTWSTLKLIKLALTALTAFSTALLRGVTLLGLLICFLAAILFFHTLFRWVSGEAIAGFATVIVLQLIIGGSIMIALGIIGEYLSQIYWETKQRPRYVLQEDQMDARAMASREMPECKQDLSDLSGDSGNAEIIN